MMQPQETENFEPSRALMCAECAGTGYAAIDDSERGQCQCMIKEEEELHA